MDSPPHETASKSGPWAVSVPSARPFPYLLFQSSFPPLLSRSYLSFRAETKGAPACRADGSLPGTCGVMRLSPRQRVSARFSFPVQTARFIHLRITPAGERGRYCQSTFQGAYCSSCPTESCFTRSSRAGQRHWMGQLRLALREVMAASSRGCAVFPDHSYNQIRTDPACSEPPTSRSRIDFSAFIVRSHRFRVRLYQLPKAKGSAFSLTHKRSYALNQRSGRGRLDLLEHLREGDRTVYRRKRPRNDRMQSIQSCATVCGKFVEAGPGAGSGMSRFVRAASPTDALSRRSRATCTLMRGTPVQQHGLPAAAPL
jgi:hypothetical protein